MKLKGMKILETTFDFVITQHQAMEFLLTQGAAAD